MSTALCVGGGAGIENPARLSVVERIRQIEAAARERDARRLERLEKRAIETRENEELRLCAMAAGEPVRLSCREDNISRKPTLNHTYYNRCAAALQTNISRWVLAIGKRYASEAVRRNVDEIGYTPALLAEIERVAKLHVAEFTITMRSEAGADLLGERQRFSRAWNAFNKRYLKEIAAEYFGEFVRVYEAHKSGVLHAHVLIECKKPLCNFGENGRPLPFKFKPSGAVDGRTVAPWVTEVWRTIRTGQLDYLGIGERHTLQPIRKGVNLFARYISKYISKDIVNRKPHLRGLRMVAYSRDFLSGCRVVAYDYDKSVIIPYFSKKHNCEKFRYKRFTSFDIECASTRVRRLKMRTLCRWLEMPKWKLKRKLGAKWGFLTRNLISKMPVAKTVYERFDKWEKFAAVRNLCGHKSNCVMRFDADGTIYDYAEFMQFPSEIRREENWHVCGFVESGEFVSLKKRLSCFLENISAEFKNVYERAKEKVIGFKDELRGWWKRLNAAYWQFDKGEISCERWLGIARGCLAKIRELEEYYDDFIERRKFPENEKTEIAIPVYEQMQFAF